MDKFDLYRANQAIDVKIDIMRRQLTTIAPVHRVFVPRKMDLWNLDKNLNWK